MASGVPGLQYCRWDLMLQLYMFFVQPVATSPLAPQRLAHSYAQVGQRPDLGTAPHVQVGSTMSTQPPAHPCLGKQLCTARHAVANVDVFLARVRRMRVARRAQWLIFFQLSLFATWWAASLGRYEVGLVGRFVFHMPLQQSRSYPERTEHFFECYGRVRP